MAQEGPSSSLPTYYGEKTAEGRVVKRPGHSEEEALITPPAPSMSVREKGPQTVPFDDEGPPSGGRNARWSMDDARRDEYWKGYWDRRRMDRERDWYPEYRGPQRYLEFDEERERMPTRAISQRGSRRESVSMRAPTSRHGGRRASFDEPLPPKRPIETEDDDYEDDYYHEGRGGMRRRRAPPPLPPSPPHGRPSLDSDGEPLRLPFTKWMNSSIKNRKLFQQSELIFKDISILTLITL
jgi:hypothetical protein